MKCFFANGMEFCFIFRLRFPNSSSRIDASFHLGHDEGDRETGSGARESFDPGQHLHRALDGRSCTAVGSTRAARHANATQPRTADSSQV